jgi:hypothetical protein
MKIIVKDVSSGKVYNIEVEGTTSVDVLKLKLSATYDLNYNLLQISFNNNKVTDSAKTMQALGVVEGSELMLQIQATRRSSYIFYIGHFFWYIVTKKRIFWSIL